MWQHCQQHNASIIWTCSCSKCSYHPYCQYAAAAQHTPTAQHTLQSDTALITCQCHSMLRQHLHKQAASAMPNKMHVQTSARRAHARETFWAVRLLEQSLSSYSGDATSPKHSTTETQLRQQKLHKLRASSSCGQQ